MKCCEQYAAALSAFADGELNGTEREELLTHIEQCEGCREYLSELMVMHAVFEEMPELDAPEGFAETVLARVHEDEQAKKRQRRVLPRVLAACAVFVLIAGAAMRFALPGMGTKSDGAACDDNGAVSEATANIADAADSESYNSYTYTAVQKDGSQYADQYTADSEPQMDAPTAGDPAGSAEKQEYLTVRVDVETAAEFLSARGMAVYSETDESVSFLVTPEVAHELGAEIMTDAAAAAALTGADDILIVEVGKAQPDTEPDTDAPADGAELPAEEEEVNR